MNAITLVSAYRQINAPEKAFVDVYVAELEREADRSNERISLVMSRVLPRDEIEASRGFLDRPLVRAAIVERINEIAAARELTQPRVVKELMGIAFSSIGHYMTVGEDGLPVIDLANCTPEQLAAVKSIEIDEQGDGLSRPKRRKIKFHLHDKIAGIRMLSEIVALLQSENAYWRDNQPKPVNGAGNGMPNDMTVDGASNAYSAMING